MASPLALALQMQQPMTSPPQAGVAPTDVTGAYKLATDAANTQYLAKLQQQNSLWGGLAGLGSAGILVAPKLMGSGLFGGASAAAPAASSTALGMPALADAAAPASTALGIGAGDAAAAAAPAVGADLGAAALAAPAAADAAASFSLADLLPMLLMA